MSIDSANGKVAAASLQPSHEVVNAILRWPEADRRDLALVLMDSIREGFTSLEEAADRQKNLIRDRLEELTSGKAELVEPEAVFAELRRRIAEVRKQ